MKQNFSNEQFNNLGHGPGGLARTTCSSQGSTNPPAPNRPQPRGSPTPVFPVAAVVVVETDSGISLSVLLEVVDYPDLQPP